MSSLYPLVLHCPGILLLQWEELAEAVAMGTGVLTGHTELKHCPLQVALVLAQRFHFLNLPRCA